MSRATAEALLRQAAATPEITFRDGQWEAIDCLVNRRHRALVVQRTGWGKSMVYFLSAKILRDQGAGPALIVSPLLALMRNQIEAAQRLGLRPATINSGNKEDWHRVRAELLANQIDLLLISPERLANDEFVTEILLPVAGRIGLLVVDEAHCISDWGHDFRPDYRRIVGVLRQLPDNIAVLATTATANTRVVADVEAQLGPRIETQRGPLARETLALQAMRLPNAAVRLAWLADYLPQLPGSGIVYTLTVADAQRVAGWLKANGIAAEAYHSGATSGDAPETNVHRERLEQKLLANELKCLVATTALGMGFDKPDLGFVIHYQAPGSVVHYYQQVGRAGRAIDYAYGILLSGREDDDIHAYFRNTAFPPEPQINEILVALEESENGMTLRQIEGTVNLRHGQIEKVLKILAVEEPAPIVKDGSKWFRTPNAWRIDRERIAHLTHQRMQEWAQMQAYIDGPDCLMQFLARALDDLLAKPCGHCTHCVGRLLVSDVVRSATLAAAQRLLRRSESPLEPKKMFPSGAFPRYGWSGARITPEYQAEAGRILARWGEVGWGEMVREGKVAGRFPDELVSGAAEMLRERWHEARNVGWVTCVPSLRHPDLVPDFARRLAAALGLPFHAVVGKLRETEPQKGMENRYHQCRNLDGVFAVAAGGAPFAEPMLLVDDVTASGWTLAVIATLLRRAGSGRVYPSALANAGVD
ncbi:MAG: RecQ family ATP-dependent DNA helicase [Betaproteobacteria bacterium]|nr:RecQ family ATP-dependent DNA helicase [Betaproteobacteria bacterium]